VPVEERDIGQGEQMAPGKRISARAGGESASTDRSRDCEREGDSAGCKETGMVEQRYFRWRKEYGGMQVDQAKRLKELEQENA
jgi:Transposase